MALTQVADRTGAGHRQVGGGQHAVRRPLAA